MTRESTERLVWELEWIVKVLNRLSPEELISHEHELGRIYASLGSLIFCLGKQDSKPCDTE